MSFYGRVVWNSQPVLINEKRLIRSPRDWHCLIIKLEHLVYPHYPQTSNALSFYWSKMILDRPNHFGWVPIVLDEPNCFGQVQIILVRSKSFWTIPNHFEQVQIMKISPVKSSFNMTKTICTCPKSFLTYSRTRH